jgi:hypothetical protein
MLRMKAKCPKHTVGLGDIIGKAKICALKPGDGSVLNCLETKKW